jgi:hypothetical protein
MWPNWPAFKKIRNFEIRNSALAGPRRRDVNGETTSADLLCACCLDEKTTSFFDFVAVTPSVLIESDKPKARAITRCEHRIRIRK